MKLGPIHAALNGREKYAGKGYLFRGGVYYRYDWPGNRADAGYPWTLGAWQLPGKFGEGIDAALNGEVSYAGYAYLFRSTQYARYDWKPDAAASGYPRPLSVWRLPAPFSGGVDAAFNGRVKYAGKAYFFRGGQYLRYDWKEDKPDWDKGEPLSRWGLPSAFLNGIDAAIEGLGDYERYVYFFRGNQYCRYDWKEDKPQPQLKSIAGNWPKLGEQLALEPLKASFYNEFVGPSRLTETTTRIPTMVTLAQAALESGWAKKRCGNNMFGIKATADWPGDRRQCTTTEWSTNPDAFTTYHWRKQHDNVGDPPRTMWEFSIDAWFRDYPDVNLSFADHAAFLMRPQFASAFQPLIGPLDPRQFADRIAAAKYATSPNYASVLKSLIADFEHIEAALPH